MKVIFLGIDGVLNSLDDFYSTVSSSKGCSHFHPKRWRGAKVPLDSFFGITRSKAKRLAKIVAKTDAKIVLVSSWGYHYDKAKADKDCDFVSKELSDHLEKELGAVGLSIYDTTKALEGETHPLRERGIHEWLKLHPEVDGWVVLDIAIPYQNIEEGNEYAYVASHLVATSSWPDETARKPEGGLTPRLAAQAIGILNMPIEKGEAK